MLSNLTVPEAALGDGRYRLLPPQPKGSSSAEPVSQESSVRPKGTADADVTGSARAGARTCDPRAMSDPSPGSAVRLCRARDESWATAPCLGQARLFDGDTATTQEQARRICLTRCSNRQQCLEEALRLEAAPGARSAGVRGGWGAIARRQELNRRRKKARTSATTGDTGTDHQGATARETEQTA
jgi:hypothetical protein